MRHILLAGAALLSACATSPDQAASDPLVGIWELQQYANTPEGGLSVREFGDRPIGLFIFTAGGHVSISFMRNPPAIDDPTVSDSSPAACVPGWYCSYFGTYSYDPLTSAWTTKVMGGNIPTYFGTDQRRTFTLDGDTMTITSSYEVDGVKFNGTRVLRRISP